MQVTQVAAHEHNTTGTEHSTDTVMSVNNQLPTVETLEDVLRKLLLCPISKVWT